LPLEKLRLREFRHGAPDCHLLEKKTIGVKKGKKTICDDKKRENVVHGVN
jgi:hypothetical protein